MTTRRKGEARDFLIGADVADQRDLRPDRPVRDLGEFVRFLEETEKVFGPIPAREREWKGKDFRL